MLCVCLYKPASKIAKLIDVVLLGNFCFDFSVTSTLHWFVGFHSGKKCFFGYNPLNRDRQALAPPGGGWGLGVCLL